MISIIGSGKVGTAIAFLCIANSLDDVLLINRTKDKAIGEALDISNAVSGNSNVSIYGTDDFSKINGSDVIVITASTGIYLKSRIEMMDAQVIMIKNIAKQIKKYINRLKEKQLSISVNSNVLTVHKVFCKKY